MVVCMISYYCGIAILMAFFFCCCCCCLIATPVIPAVAGSSWPSHFFLLGLRRTTTLWYVGYINLYWTELHGSVCDSMLWWFCYFIYFYFLLLNCSPWHTSSSSRLSSCHSYFPKIMNSSLEYIITAWPVLSEICFPLVHAVY